MLLDIVKFLFQDYLEIVCFEYDIFCLFRCGVEFVIRRMVYELFFRFKWNLIKKYIINCMVYISFILVYIIFWNCKVDLYLIQKFNNL